MNVKNPKYPLYMDEIFQYVDANKGMMPDFDSNTDLQIIKSAV